MALYTPAAPDIPTILFDLLHTTKGSQSRVAGFCGSHDCPEVFFNSILELEAQFLGKVIFGLILVKQPPQAEAQGSH